MTNLETDDPQDPEAKLRALRAAAQNDPEAKLAALRADPNAQLHTDYKSGKLRRDVASANEREAAAIPDNPLTTAVLEAATTPLAGVPGGSVAMSLARKGLTRESRSPLADIQQDVNRATSDIPYASALGRMVGGVATTGILPASGMKGGAILGGLDQFLNNDPNSGVGARLGRGVVGAGAGGVLGGVTDRLITGGRALIGGNAANIRAGMLADQAASAKQLYGQALSEGQGRVMPAEVKAWLASEDIAPIVADLKATRPFANVSEESPEMVDAVYKNLSDKAGVMKSKLGAVVPRNANLGRVAAADNAMARQEGLDAVAAPNVATGDPAFMPTYPKAVQDFATKARAISSFDKGYDALKGSDVAAKNLNRPEKTGEGLADWLSGPKSNAADAENATAGMLGRIRRTGQPSLSINPLKGFGLPKSDAFLSPLRTADAATGNTLPSGLQRAILALTQQRGAATMPDENHP